MIDQISNLATDSNVYEDIKNIEEAEESGMNSAQMFKALIKAYTGESLHDEFAKKMIKAKYE